MKRKLISAAVTAIFARTLPLRTEPTFADVPYAPTPGRPEGDPVQSSKPAPGIDAGTQDQETGHASQSDNGILDND